MKIRTIRIQGFTIRMVKRTTSASDSVTVYRNKRLVAYLPARLLPLIVEEWEKQMETVSE